MIFFSVINAFHNLVNYSTVKFCVLYILKKKVINTRIRIRPVCSFAQFMLLNTMPQFALDLLWIHISVTQPILKYLHQEADKTRAYSA